MIAVRLLAPLVAASLALAAPAEAAPLARNGAIAFEGVTRGASSVYLGTTTPRRILAGSSSPGFAPDGRKLAYERAGDLFVSRVDGSGRSRVTTSTRFETSDRDPAWSPGGTRLAFGRTVFVSDVGLVSSVYTVPASGGRITRITSGAEPSWSVKGRLVFTRSDHLFTVGARGGAARQLTRGRASDSSPAWSPDGAQVAFVRNDDLYRVGAGGGRPRRLVRDAQDPAWSPDGRQIAFIRARDLYVLTLGGGLVRRLVGARGLGADELRAPAWQPLR